MPVRLHFDHGWHVLFTVIFIIAASGIAFGVLARVAGRITRRPDHDRKTFEQIAGPYDGAQDKEDQ